MIAVALDLLPYLPEIVIALAAVGALLACVFTTDDVAPTLYAVAISALIAALVITLLWTPLQEEVARVFVQDGFARYAKLLILAAGALSMILALLYARAHSFERRIFPGLVLLGTLGMMLMVSAHDLVGAYLAVELQALAVCCAVAMRRGSALGDEAALKLLTLGALSSALMVFGVSVVFTFTGATRFDEVAAALGGQGPSMGATVGMVLVLAGLAFKVSAAPFHAFVPDVYEGAPGPVVTFLAAVPFIAAFALLTRVLMDAFEPLAIEWQHILVILSALSMLVGSLAAMAQTNLMRMLAYASIGHAGFILMGLAAGSDQGVEGVVVYGTTYVATILGVFACLLGLQRVDQGQVEEIDDLAGLIRTQPWTASALALLSLSLIGVPPLIGFFGKLFVFLAAIEAELMVLAIIGVFASLVLAYAHLRLVRVMLIDEPSGWFEAVPAGMRTVVILAGAFSVLFLMVWTPILSAATEAAQSLF